MLDFTNEITHASIQKLAAQLYIYSIYDNLVICMFILKAILGTAPCLLTSKHRSYDLSSMDVLQFVAPKVGTEKKTFRFSAPHGINYNLCLIFFLICQCEIMLLL